MNKRLQKVYQEFYRQAFIPILVNDGLDAKLQVEACVQAGFKVIEYTQRREDLKTILPWIQKTYPDLYVIIGSTMDNDLIVKSQQRQFPHLLTLEELAELNVHGFISMLKYSTSTIQQYRNTHLLIPCASTTNEAYDLLSDGAHFIKVLGPDLTFVKRISSAPLFKFCPLFVTGGMDLERIPLAIEAGAMFIASGFDLMLKDQDNITVESVCGILKKYQTTVISARAALYPEMTEALDKGTTEEWLKQVPHYIPFWRCV
jgi:2-keto-3-deoxy-6-phosphogluconate aldolase